MKPITIACRWPAVASCHVTSFYREVRMALHRALNLVVDPRDKARSERLSMVTGEAGAFRCHTLGNCRDVCPRGISPTHSIERLKRLSTVAVFKRLFGKLFA